MPTCIGIVCDLCAELACECDIVVIDSELNVCPVCVYKLGFRADDQEQGVA